MALETTTCPARGQGTSRSRTILLATKFRHMHVLAAVLRPFEQLARRLGRGDMKRATISLALAMTFCARSPSTSNDGSSTGGAGGTSNAGGTTNTGGTSKGGNTSNTGGTTNAGSVCNVIIPYNAGDTCDIESPPDAGVPLDAGTASDLTKMGPYAVGHVNYTLSDTSIYARSVIVGVWYPVDSGTITSTSPPAQYPMDPWSNNLPVSKSTDWEALGYDPAYEGPTPSAAGPFPLVMVSPGWGWDNWEYIFIGTRLASHGFVVAVTDHYHEGQLNSGSGNNLVVSAYYRTLDVSFALTELMLKNAAPGEPLHAVIDSSRIAMSGHSLGGYAAYALAGGDDEVCDTLWGTYFNDSLPEPQFTCVPAPADPRIRAIVSLDGVSPLMRYRELARIPVPSLIMGETVEHIVSYNSIADPNANLFIARPHAAINRRDSYRVDVTIADHTAFTDWCDGLKVMASLGVTAINGIALSGSIYSSDCVIQGTFDPANNPVTHQIVTTYMLAFLNTYLGREDDSWMLTSSYARQYQPNVEFFDSEACNECPVGDGEYSYRPHPCQCSVARKDPANYFAPSSDGGAQ